VIAAPFENATMGMNPCSTTVNWFVFPTWVKEAVAKSWIVALLKLNAPTVESGGVENLVSHVTVIWAKAAEQQSPERASPATALSTIDFMFNI